jgi:hypothetical protein
MSFIRLPIWLLVFVAALLPLLAIAQDSYDYGFNISTILKRETSTFFAVTGVDETNAAGGSVPVRQDIRQLELDKITWTLYILGLDILQSTSQAQMLSWYQIAGMKIFESWSTVTDQLLRNPWGTPPSLRRRKSYTWELEQWLLHTRLNSLSNMAPPISRSVRTSAVWVDSTDCFILACRRNTKSVCGRCSEV